MSVALPSSSRCSRISEISIGSGISRWQKITAMSALAVFVVGVAWKPQLALSNVVLLIILMFSLVVGVKFYLALKGGDGVVDIPSSQLLADEECPDISVLVPMYKEAAVVESLVRNLSAMDYPARHFRPIILLEEIDTETRSEFQRITASLPSNFQVVVVPASYRDHLRGKPRAMEYLRLERPDLIMGQIVGIYDAEDNPETDQLRKVATAFAQNPEVACFQAELRWHNAFQNWRTGCIALNYAMHYQVLLPALIATRGIVSLGGTSNFFRLSTLNSVGGWDEAHVAEDQDLGCKLVRAGYTIRMLRSVTWEEATVTVRRQIDQSSRWTKGSIATTISHTRHPGWFLRDCGWWGTLTFLSTISFSHPAALFAPVFWAMTIVYALTQTVVVQQITPVPAFYVGSLCLIANFFFLLKGMFAAIMSQQPKLVLYIPLLPLHWLVVGGGAGMLAAYEVLRGRISYWRKTEHGLVEVTQAAQPWRSVVANPDTVEIGD